MLSVRKRWLVLAGMVVVVASIATVVFVVMPRASAASPSTQHYGPFAAATPDSGTCGNNWANDTFERHFSVDTQPNADGTYNVVEEFKNGTFVTVAGFSPGSCQPGNPLVTIPAGITGELHGSFNIVVSTGTFNPSAVCTPSMCGTTAGFIATVFGGSASYAIPTFEFHYNAANCGDWKNASADRGGNRGDIACASA
jgi:hypothetical protein